MQLNITVDPSRAQDALLSYDYAVSPAGLSYFMQTRAAQWLQRRGRDRFSTEGDSASGDWVELKASTIDIRQHEGYVPIRINRRTNALHNWVVNSKGVVSTAGAGTMLTWPGEAPSLETQKKLQTAQRGKSHPRTVARPVLAVDETDLAGILSLLGEFVVHQSIGTRRRMTR